MTAVNVTDRPLDTQNRLHFSIRDPCSRSEMGLLPLEYPTYQQATVQVRRLISAHGHRIKSSRTRTRVRSNTVAINHGILCRIPITGSIRCQQLPIPLNGHLGWKIRTSRSNVLVNHSNQQVPREEFGPTY